MVASDIKSIVATLEAAGLVAKIKQDGKTILGGTSITKSFINIVENAFYIESEKEKCIAIITGPGQLTTEQSFGSYQECAEFIIKEYRVKGLISEGSN